jgi:hypothetical protein
MCCFSTCPPKLCCLAFDDLLGSGSIRPDSKTIINLDVCVESGISKMRWHHFKAAPLAPTKTYKSLSFSPSLLRSFHTTHLLENPLKTLVRRNHVCFLPSSFENRIFDLMAQNSSFCNACVESEGSKSLPRERIVGLLAPQWDIKHWTLLCKSFLYNRFLEVLSKTAEHIYMCPLWPSSRLKIPSGDVMLPKNFYDAAHVWIWKSENPYCIISLLLCWRLRRDMNTCLC